MDLKRKLGQLLMFGFADREPESAYQLIDEYHCGGLILFAHNVSSRDQLVNLTASLQERARQVGLPPLLISIDQEGGRVDRLGPELFPSFAPNWETGIAYAEAGDDKAVRNQAKSSATALLDLGINMNLAPVLDVVTVEGNEVIGDRSYGSDPRLAAELGATYITALQSAGVVATAKHYPGHGPTHVDSHTGLPVVELQGDELREVHLAPFVSAIQSGVAAIMPAHITYPAWDNVPATLSHRLLTTMLRDELGFHGVVITDDMNMHAISRHFPFPGSLATSLTVGADILLVCDAPGIHPGVWNAVTSSAEAGEIPEERIDQSYKRVLEMKARFGLLEPGGHIA